MNLDFSKTSILIVGDCMLDRYHFGDVNRISPEAPVPIVRIRRTTQTLGGAANVANNVACLGAVAQLIGIVGNDTEQTSIKSLCATAHINTSFIQSKFPTITKTRIIGAHQQMMRLDFEEPSELGEELEQKIISRAIKLLAKAKCLIISDYGKGVCSPRVCKVIIAAARDVRCPVIVDPKSHNWAHYAHATFVTPNLKELAMAAGVPLENLDSPVITHGKKLLKKFHLDHVLITRSEKGMTLLGAKSAIHMHSRAQEVFDVSGAGDTVVASFAVALAAGNSLEDALEIANYSAGIVVAKIGTVPVTLGELKKELAIHKTSAHH